MKLTQFFKGNEIVLGIVTEQGIVIPYGKKLYLLSNYPQQGYERLREKFAELFDPLFDGGVISCYVHQIKPEKEIYQTLISRYELDPQRTLFIDDTLCNIEGAMKMGIHGFHLHESGMLDRFFI